MNFIETIFSHAVALTQSGRLRNEIFCKNNLIYVSNFDNTVLLKFDMPKSINLQEISFEANDYESNDFSVDKDGNVVFTTKTDLFIKKKICGKIKLSFKEIDDLFNKYFKETDNLNSLNFHNSILSLLDESLSHVEFSIQKKQANLVQRDIYTGKKLLIKENLKGFRSIHEIKSDLNPIGLRVNDFFAVFSFCENVKFYFIEGNEYCLLSSELKMGPSGNISMKGVIAGCLYDELETIDSIGEDNGREESKDRRGKQKTNTKINKRKSSK